MGYSIIPLLKIYTACDYESILKIGQYLAKMWTPVCWHRFMTDDVLYLQRENWKTRRSISGL